MAYICIWREENNSNNLYIFVPVFWNKTSFPIPTSFFSDSNTNFNHLFLLFFFIGRSLPQNGILCIEIFFLGSATFCNVLWHIYYPFSKVIFFTIEKDTARSLGLRGIRVLEAIHGERRLMRMVEQNGGKFRRLEKIILKKSLSVGIKTFFG